MRNTASRRGTGATLLSQVASRVHAAEAFRALASRSKNPGTMGLTTAWVFTFDAVSGTSLGRVPWRSARPIRGSAPRGLERVLCPAVFWSGHRCKPSPLPVPAQPEIVEGEAPVGTPASRSSRCHYQGVLNAPRTGSISPKRSCDSCKLWGSYRRPSSSRAIGGRAAGIQEARAPPDQQGDRRVARRSGGPQGSVETSLRLGATAS